MMQRICEGFDRGSASCALSFFGCDKVWNDETLEPPCKEMRRFQMMVFRSARQETIQGPKIQKGLHWGALQKEKGLSVVTRDPW